MCEVRGESGDRQKIGGWRWVIDRSQEVRGAGGENREEESREEVRSWEGSKKEE